MGGGVEDAQQSGPYPVWVWPGRTGGGRSAGSGLGSRATAEHGGGGVQVRPRSRRTSGRHWPRSAGRPHHGAVLAPGVGRHARAARPRRVGSASGGREGGRAGPDWFRAPLTYSFPRARTACGTPGHGGGGLRDPGGPGRPYRHGRGPERCSAGVRIRHVFPEGLPHGQAPDRHHRRRLRHRRRDGAPVLRAGPLRCCSSPVSERGWRAPTSRSGRSCWPSPGRWPDRCGPPGSGVLPRPGGSRAHGGPVRSGPVPGCFSGPRCRSGTGRRNRRGRRGWWRRSRGPTARSGSGTAGGRRSGRR